MISAIVPVYNNEATVSRVIEVLLACRRINELIVVDDGSTDQSEKMIRQFTSKIIFLKNRKNLGKGGTVVRGIKKSGGEVILTCDADLAKLNKQHIETMIDEYKKNGWDMVIAARETVSNYWGRLMGRVSGERIFKKSVIVPYLGLARPAGNGIEQVVNYAHRNKKIKVIVSKNIGHVLKFQRGNLIEWIGAYAKEAGQLIRTELVLRGVLPTGKLG